MKIAQVSPLVESVPPRGYGGTERIVSYLTEALVEQGHDVTLFASADSITSADLVPCAKRALRLDPDVGDPTPHMALMLEKIRARASKFDILHFHIDYWHFPMFRTRPNRTLTTLHGRQDLPDMQTFYSEFNEMPLVSISNAQRAPIRNANFRATVHHGLPRNLYRPVTSPQRGYLAFLGRISPEKRCDRAIAIAKAANMPLKIAAKVDKVDRAYFREVVEPLLNHPLVELIGEIEEHQKNDFLSNAAALLFPIDWPEPFGLAMIESMACGTPVLAFNRGSVPEIIEDGTNGYIVSTVEEAIAKLDAVLALDRSKVRRRFEERFTADRMARDYVKLYDSLLKPDEAQQPHELAVLLREARQSAQDDTRAAEPKVVDAA
jgi:glycosyltransferase involved in cell wall biosynthesis